jgi:hypothetical protein
LEGNALWDKMTLSLLDEDFLLTADPNQVKQYLQPVKIDILQDDGTYAKSNITIEDSSTTRWLDKNDNLVRVGDLARPEQKDCTSYSGFIWNV